MPDQFQYDAFLSHSSKDKAVVRPLAERLRQDGLKVWFDEWVLKPGDSIPAKIDPPSLSLEGHGAAREGLEQPRALPAGRRTTPAAGSITDVPSTINSRPSTSPRRFIPLRLDNAHDRNDCWRRKRRVATLPNLGHKTCYERNANPDSAWSCRN